MSKGGKFMTEKLISSQTEESDFESSSKTNNSVEEAEKVEEAKEAEKSKKPEEVEKAEVDEKGIPKIIQQ